MTLEIGNHSSDLGPFAFTNFVEAKQQENFYLPIYCVCESSRILDERKVLLHKPNKILLKSRKRCDVALARLHACRWPYAFSFIYQMWPTFNILTAVASRHLVFRVSNSGANWSSNLFWDNNIRGTDWCEISCSTTGIRSNECTKGFSRHPNFISFF